MMINFLKNIFGKKRRYPIKHDSTGKSARRRAFEQFDKGLRPAQVAPFVDISPKTAYRYFEDWKKRPKNFEKKCNTARLLLKKDKELSDRTLNYIAKAYGYPVNQLRSHLQEPWGLKRLVMGRLAPKPQRQSLKGEYARLEAAIDFVLLFEKCNLPPDKQMKLAKEITEAFQKEIKGRKGED